MVSRRVKAITIPGKGPSVPAGGPTAIEWAAAEIDRLANNAAIARLDAAVFDLRKYGVTGSGTETAKVQTAINDAVSDGGGVILYPPFPVTAPGLIVDGPGVTFRGASRYASMLAGAAGDLITLDGAAGFGIEHMYLYNDAAGGDVLFLADSLTFARFYDLAIVQLNPARSILNADDEGLGTLNYIDNLWLHVETLHTLTATEPTFKLSGGAINRNAWTDMRVTNSGEYTWHIESTAAAAYATDNTIARITGEVLNGGVARLRGCRGTKLEDIGIYDNGVSTNDLFEIANSTVPSMTTTFDNVRRVGGTLGSGLYDVNILTTLGWTDTTFRNCGFHPTGFQVNANSKTATVQGGYLTVANDEAVTYLPEFGKALTSPYGVNGGRYTTAARNAWGAAAAGNGTQVYDTTLGKPIWSNGTVWKDAAGTTV